MARSLPILATLLLLAGAGLAGCSDGVASTDRPPAVSGGSQGGKTVPELPANRTVVDFSTVQMMGSTPVGGCVFTVVGHCEFLDDGTGNLQALTFQGKPLWLDGNASLDGQVDGINLQVILFATINGTMDFAPTEDAFHEGPSPLHFRIDLSKLPDVPLTLGVYSATGAGAPVGFVVVNIPQEFQLRATLAYESKATTDKPAVPTA